MNELTEQRNRLQFFNGPEFAEAMSFFLENFTRVADRTNLADENISDEDKASSGLFIRVATNDATKEKAALLVFKSPMGQPFGKYHLGKHSLVTETKGN